MSLVKLIHLKLNLFNVRASCPKPIHPFSQSLLFCLCPIQIKTAFIVRVWMSWPQVNIDQTNIFGRTSPLKTLTEHWSLTHTPTHANGNSLAVMRCSCWSYSQFHTNTMTQTPLWQHMMSHVLYFVFPFFPLLHLTGHLKTVDKICWFRWGNRDAAWVCFDTEPARADFTSQSTRHRESPQT